MIRRIAYVDQTSSFGGALTALQNALPYLRGLGFEAHVILTHVDTRMCGAMERCSDAVYVLAYKRRPRDVAERLEDMGARRSFLKWPYLCWVTLVESCRECWWAFRLWRLLRRIRPDIVHGNNGPGFNRSALLVARLMRLRSVVTVRGGSGQTRLLDRLAETGCDWEIFVSQYTKQLYRSPQKRISVLYDGLDMKQWPPPERHMAGPHRLRYGHVGMLTQAKGQDIFLRAAIQVGNRYPETAFYLFGDSPSSSNQSYARELREIARTSSCAERIHFMGFWRDIPAALQMVDVLVHSSIEPESYGMVILEGMARGLAVIAPDVGGPREIICHGADGLLIQPGKPEILAETMAELACDNKRVESLGRAARTKVEERFTAERAATELVELYHRILKA